MYRVYNHEKKEWVRNDVYLSPNNDLYVAKKNLFGKEKLGLVSDKKFTWHKDIGLTDMHDVVIFEGDICKNEEKDIMGVVTYIPSHASYYLLDDRTLKYYPLTEEVCNELEIVGNVIENQDMLPQDEVAVAIEGDA